MATQKDLRFIYQSKNSTAGLTDILAEVYLNKVAKAVAGSAISFTATANGSVITALDATNSPGVYEVLIKAADLTAYGVAQGQYNALEVVVNSTSTPAEAIFRTELTVANTDDIDLKLGTPAGASVSADIAQVETNVLAIKADLETGSSSLANIFAAVQAIQNGVISNGIGYVIPALIIPASGSTTYKIPITVMNNDGALVDPTSNTVTVGLLNAAGTDRGSYLTGASGSPATVSATRDSVGQYHVVVVVPSTAVQEDLIFSFAYSIGANAMVRYGQSQTITDVNADGFALQTTLLNVQTTVNSTQALASGSNGFAAINSAVAALQADLDTNVEGSGFSNSTDSLHQISAYMRANLYTGGRAV